jgi:CRISPR-associated protein Cas2
MRLLIIYDIRDAKRLHKVAKVMESFGTRVQKSVFEAELPKKVFKRLRYKIQQVIDLENDYLVYFSICQRDWEKREKFGSPQISLPEDQAFEIL